MAIRNSQPMVFTPMGLVDAYDATRKFPGACLNLANLTYDQVNPEFVVTRAGVTSFVIFDLFFKQPSFISIHIGVGQRIYGMVTTQRNPGFDEPFCYDASVAGFISISGVTNANTPTSPVPSGADWTPPTMAVVGVMVVVTHPGFSGANGYYGIIDITNPAAPAWRSENTAINALTAVPSCVANFNNRAYFGVGNQLEFTDALINPLQRTNATQAYTVGNTDPINCVSGLPNQTTSAGVVQALIVFKKTQVWQFNGDITTANDSLNFLSLNIGTVSPRTVVQSPIGLYFASSGGPWFVDLLGGVRAVTNKMSDTMPDIVVPFQNAQLPTRWAAAYNAMVYRVCGQTVVQGAQAVNDYWFDEHRRRWNGAHSFAYDCASTLGTLFVLSYYQFPGSLFIHNPITTNSSPVTDSGALIPFNMTSSLFPKAGDMLTKECAESELELQSINGPTPYTIAALNEAGNNIGSTTITAGVGPQLPGIWGIAIWGQFTWDSVGALLRPYTYPVPWTAPLVFEKMQIQITGNTLKGQAGIGTFQGRFQKTGYMTTGNP